MNNVCYMYIIYECVHEHVTHFSPSPLFLFLSLRKDKLWISMEFCEAGSLYNMMHGSL